MYFVACQVVFAKGDDDSVSRIDPRTSSVNKAISVGEQPAAVAAGGGSVWVANSGDGSVSRIDPESNRVIDAFSVGHSPQASPSPAAPRR